MYRANALVELENGLKIRPELSADHRYVIGKELADNPEKQEEWAEISINEKLTPAELRMSIQRGTLVKGLRNERSPGIITFESVFMQFQRAVRQYGGIDEIRKMNEDERERIADLLEPVTEFISQIKG